MDDLATDDVVAAAELVVEVKSVSLLLLFVSSDLLLFRAYIDPVLV